MKIPRLTEKYTIGDLEVVSKLAYGYNCGFFPVQLVSSLGAAIFGNSLYRCTNKAFETSFDNSEFYTLRFYYALQVWRYTMGMFKSKGRYAGGDLYCLDCKVEYGDDHYGQVIYNTPDLKKSIELFYESMEKVAESGIIKVCEGMWIESRNVQSKYSHDNNNDPETSVELTDVYVVKEETPYNNTVKHDIPGYEYPFDKTPQTFSWNEIKEYFITLTPDQVMIKNDSYMHRPNELNSSLLKACMNLDMEAVKQAVNDGADVNCFSKYGNTPICECVSALIEYGRPENPLEDEYLDTQEKSIAIIQYLLSMGADPNLFGGDFCDLPLTECFVAHAPKIMKLLLDNGADPNVNNEIGCTREFRLHEDISSGPLQYYYDWDADNDIEAKLEEEMYNLLRAHGAVLYQAGKLPDWIKDNERMMKAYQ